MSSAQKELIRFRKNGESSGAESFDELLDGICGFIRERGYISDALLVVVGVNTDAEEYVLNEVGGWAWLAFCEIKKDVSYTDKELNGELCFVKVYNLYSDNPSNPILFAKASPRKDGPGYHLIPINYDFDFLEIRVIAEELEKLQQFRPSQNVKWFCGK